MIGKAEWFQRRKYSGWGISPKTWQGWVYLIFIFAPFIIFQSLPFWDVRTRILFTVFWVAFLLFDVTHIMISLKRDEREYKIEAISERNSAWTMVLVLAIGISYQIITSALNKEISVDLFLVIALFAGAIVKTVSNITLEKSEL